MQKREIQIMIKSSNKNQRKISLMDNDTRSLVGLTDENFITDEDWLEIKHENHEEIYIINRKWDKDCKCCPYYRNKNIIKHTPTPHKIILPLLRERKTYLELKLQRFICKDCGKTWSTDCSIAPRNSNTSYELNYQILSKLKEYFSRKDIVKLYGISDKTVERIMEKFKVFNKFENGVKAAFQLSYSNGVIEGMNNLIKVIKRVAYGYRNFEFMKIRIKIITGYYFNQKKKTSVMSLKYDYYVILI